MAPLPEKIFGPGADFLAGRARPLRPLRACPGRTLFGKEPSGTGGFDALISPE
jgi:hypothetical protein